MAIAEKPRARSFSASSSVSFLVRTKTIIALEVLDLEDAGERVDLLRVGADEVALGGVGAGGGLVLDRDLDRVVEVLLGDPADLAGHRRGEQRDVLVVGGVGQDRLDVLGEAHLQHLVGLVEDQEAQLREVERALLEVVHDPAGRADDDVDAATQRGQLDAVALAAVDRQDVDALHVGGVLLERLGDLQGELAGGREHEGLRRLLREVELGEDRQREGRGLAGAGLREAHHVAGRRAAAGWLGLDRRTATS